MFRIVVVLGCLSSIGYYLISLWGARRFLREADKDRAGTFTPPVSLLKPLRGNDPQIYKNLRSHCFQKYPEFEIIFGVSNPNDPAVPIIERLAREFPERTIRLVVCPKILGTNLKVSNLIQMLAVARNDYLIVNDSDIRVVPDYLRRVISPLESEPIGLVTCLYRGIPAGSFGSRMEALGITDFVGAVLAARQIEGGIHFGLGSTLAFHRKALAAIGGFEPLADYLADDFELGQRIANANFEVLVSDCVVDNYLPDYTFLDFFQHQLRWGRGTFHSRPWGYTGLILTFGFPWAILAVIAAQGAPWGWALLGAVVTLRFAIALVIGRRVLEDRELLHYFWLLPLRDLIALLVWLGSYTGRHVVWRGNEFILKDGKLHPAGSAINTQGC